MKQETRSKIAMILAVVLVPLMIYLLFANIKKARERRRPSSTEKETEVAAKADASASIAGAAAALESAQHGKQAGIEKEPLDPDILKKQQQIAALSPKRNPFGASADRSKRSSQKKTVAARRPLMKLKLNAIIPHRVPSKRMAMINGKMLQEGATIGEWTIVRINNDSVVLDNGTREIRITLR